MTPDTLAPIIRILLRWIGGYLVARGFTTDPSTFGDPELVKSLCFIAAGLCGVVSEGWWYLARKHGWAK